MRVDLGALDNEMDIPHYAKLKIQRCNRCIAQHDIEVSWFNILFKYKDEMCQKYKYIYIIYRYYWSTPRLYMQWDRQTDRQYWRCPWCNGYRRRKWTLRYEFKSWTRQIAFHIALIPLRKVWIQLFSLQLWVNSRQTGFFSLGEATSLEGKLWIQTC